MKMYCRGYGILEESRIRGLVTLDQEATGQ